MSTDAWLFVFALLDEGTLLFLSVYFVITLSDLESDYLNATTCCDKLNMWMMPEIIAQVIPSVFFLFTGHWILFLIYTPLGAWLIYKMVKTPSGNIGIFDPTEIHNRLQLKVYMRESLIRLGSHLFFFFIFLYLMIYALVKGDEIS